MLSTTFFVVVLSKLKAVTSFECKTVLIAPLENAVPRRQVITILYYPLLPGTIKLLKTDFSSVSPQLNKVNSKPNILMISHLMKNVKSLLLKKTPCRVGIITILLSIVTRHDKITEK